MKGDAKIKTIRKSYIFLIPALCLLGSFLASPFHSNFLAFAGQQQERSKEIILIDPQKRSKIKTIVIDPGHGGEELGAEGVSGIYEKDIVLDLALRLKRQLQREEELKVMLTREKDINLSLDERTAIANHNHADLFISIHVNASKGKKVKGAETFFLSYEATDEEIRTLAALENNAVGIPEKKLDGGKIEMILWDMAQMQYLQESSELAETIQAELNELLGIKDRGVKQAPFRVLMGATMPAVLIEVGFLSNPEEEEELRKGIYRESIARAVYQSVLSYRDLVERKMGRSGGQKGSVYTNQ
jgi:N-acetylmuramoyl-L-alanine amidase